MRKKILLLGHTGKMGQALLKTLSPDYLIIGKNSSDFSATDFKQITTLVNEHCPEIIINTVAFMGIDACEMEPEKAMRINTLFPGHLAQLSSRLGSTLVHFSTDAVFNDEKQDYCTENDTPAPLQLYGVTKYGGECLVRGGCQRHYIFRVPLLFGESGRNTQFVEKMLALLLSDKKNIRVSSDIVSSPTYSMDVAGQVGRVLAGKAAFGVYHLANQGKASLYELMAEIVANLEIDAVLEKASFLDFQFVGRKNTFTPLTSVKTESLRPWREAVHDYCRYLKNQW